MPYPQADLRPLLEKIEEYCRLKHEWGAPGGEDLWRRVQTTLARMLDDLQQLPIDPGLARREPDDLAGIRRLRPDGPRRLWRSFDPRVYREKLEGALLGRMAGCTLGAIVEGWPVAEMEEWAAWIGDPFPPVDYWSQAKDPSRRRYGVSACRDYTRGGMDGVPADDDLAYTLLGLLIAEEYGPGFTTADVGRAWLKYLPYACTAEEAALANLRKGVEAARAAEIDNPYVQWIGAAIRADPWAYLAPGQPEKAAGLAYRDACLSHRRNGIYGEMFFAAVQSAAFAVDDPREALRIGLTEIPRESTLAREIRWALAESGEIAGYRQARKAVDDRFCGMSPVHIINNACLTTFGLSIGGRDVTRVLAETVAMGLDNDCNAATAGSIAGAAVGKSGIPPHWYARFHNIVRSYLIGAEEIRLDDLAGRFAAQAEKVFASW